MQTINRTASGPRLAFHCTGRASSLVFVLLLVGTLPAAPTVSSVFPRGVQIGGTTRLTVKGRQLAGHPRLHPFLPGKTEVVESHDDRLIVDVTVDNDMSAGLMPLRVVTDGGISNATMIGVDRLPQLAMQSEIGSTPVALHGQLSGDQMLRVSFVGQGGQRLVIDLEGNRLGSKIRPVLRLLDSGGRPIAGSRGQSILAGDARIDHRLPKTDRYTITLNDIIYKGPSPGFFRLKIGDLRYADLAYPLAVANGVTTRVSYASSNIAETTVVHGIPGLGASSRTVPWPADTQAFFTGAKPRVQVSQFGPLELKEDELAERTIPWLPVGASGRILEAGEADEYVIDITQHRKLRVELFAQRLGSPLDAVVTASTKDGKQLARNDDQAGTVDPGFDVDVPQDVQQLVVRIASLTGQHGNECVYRLTVTPREPTWRISTGVDRLNLPAGSRQIVMVNVDRGGSNGSLDLSLPVSIGDTVRLESSRIQPEDEIGLVSFQSSETSRGVFSVAVTGVDTSSVTHSTIFMSTASFPGSQYRPDLREELVIAVTPPAPIAVSWATPHVRPLARGTTRPLAVKLQRTDQDSSAKVRLSLLTSQKTPMKQEGNKQVVDLTRALRISQTPVVGPATDVHQLQLIAPVELPQHRWSVAVKAELLSDDEQQVRATAYTPIRRMETIQPVELQAEIPGEISVELAAEMPPTIEGKLIRHPDFPHRVQVTLQGQPKEVKLPPITVEPDETEFKLPLRFEADSKTGEFKNVQLVASFVDGDESMQAVRSRSKTFTLKIAPKQAAP